MEINWLHQTDANGRNFGTARLSDGTSLRYSETYSGRFDCMHLDVESSISGTLPFIVNETFDCLSDFEKRINL